MSYAKSTFNNDLIKISVRLPNQLVVSINELAEKSNMSFSQYLRMVLYSVIPLE